MLIEKVCQITYWFKLKYGYLNSIERLCSSYLLIDRQRLKDNKLKERRY